MKTYKIKVKDAKPEVGIFELIDGKFFVNEREPSLENAVRIGNKWIDDAGEMFHYDLVNSALEQGRISEEIVNKCNVIKEHNRNVVHQLFPRGRVTAEYTNNSRIPSFIVYLPSELKDGEYLERIIRNFNLNPDNVTFYIDNYAYKTEDLDEVYNQYK